jgi:acetylglutamate synthase
MAPTQAAAYERGLAGATAQTATHLLSPYTVEAYRQCAQEIRNVGAVPIFLITPSVTQINTAAEGDQVTGVVMTFNNPRTYPSLYDSSARRDEQHLTKSGAEEFTRIVAANFVELVREGNMKR